jgi:hypothetical protein
MNIQSSAMEPDSRLEECSVCLFHTGIIGISISSLGICNICQTVIALKDEYGTGTTRGQEALSKIVEEIKKSSKKRKYDCVIGVSGGTDSSYLLLLAKEWGLRPLAVHYDNTWNSATATTNISVLLKTLEIDLVTYVVRNKEADDIFRSAFLAGVAELDASTDLAFAYLLRKIARKNKIQFILEGHSFLEEGITPLGRNYFDGSYIRDIHGRYGSIGIGTYPLMTLIKFLREISFSNIQFIRPLWYIDYKKETAKEQLRTYGWKDYGGHHLENWLSAYMHSSYLPEKFSTDMRNNALSALIRRGAITKHEAKISYALPPHGSDSATSYFIKRIGLSREEYKEIMEMPPKSWTEFKTYKRSFEVLRPFFRILLKRRRITQSFFLKYCEKGEYL